MSRTSILNFYTDSDIGEWRALTLKHCKSLSMTNQRLPARVAHYLLKLFLPWAKSQYTGLLSRSNRSYQHHPQLKSDLTDLCQLAYQLAVMMRQSSDRYYFEPIPEETLIKSSENEIFEPEDMIGPKSEFIGSRVWVTLSSALIKELQIGECHVLAKARVICKA